jgi:DNA-binding PucR family transcriptional regulator
MTERLPGSFTILKNNDLITIYEMKEEYDRACLVDLIHRIFEKSRYILSQLKIDYACRVVVSEVIKTQVEFKNIYENTLQVFNMDLWNKGRLSYNFYEDLEIKKFLMKNSPEDLESFVLKTLGPLIDYHNASRKDLFDTLKMYLKTGKDFALCRDRLHIHPNTLTYRINRLKEILDIDFREYHDVLKLQIALEILEISSEFKGFDLNKIEQVDKS